MYQVLRLIIPFCTSVQGYTKQTHAWRLSGIRAVGACQGATFHANRLGQRGAACGEERETVDMGEQLDVIRQCFLQA